MITRKPNDHEQEMMKEFIEKMSNREDFLHKNKNYMWISKEEISDVDVSTFGVAYLKNRAVRIVPGHINIELANLIKQLHHINLDIKTFKKMYPNKRAEPLNKLFRLKNDLERKITFLKRLSNTFQFRHIISQNNIEELIENKNVNILNKINSGNVKINNKIIIRAEKYNKKLLREMTKVIEKVKF